MIVGLFKEGFGWFVSLTEVGVAIALILLAGLVVGVAAFWMLSRFLRKLAGPPAELDPYEDEPDQIDDPV